MGLPALELAGRWVDLGLSFETEISGRPLANCYYMGPGGLWWCSVLNSALPPQRLRPDTTLVHPDPVSHTAIWEAASFFYLSLPFLYSSPVSNFTWGALSFPASTARKSLHQLCGRSVHLASRFQLSSLFHKVG